MGGDEFDGEMKGELPFLHTWKLERLSSPSSSSLGKNCRCSHAFHAGGYNWKLALYPGEIKSEDGDGKHYFSLFLTLVDVTSLPPYSAIEVTAELSILDGNVSYFGGKKVIKKCRESESEECDPFLMSLETLKCPSTGFFIVEVIDVIVRTEEHEDLSPELEDLNDYTWIIDDFSKLGKEEYLSEVFLMKGKLWYLKLYPKGNREDNFVSLYVELDGGSILHPTDNVDADFLLQCMDQINGNHHGRRFCHQFNSSEFEWGFERFMSLDDLCKPSKGFLVGDTCVIRITNF